MFRAMKRKPHLDRSGRRIFQGYPAFGEGVILLESMTKPRASFAPLRTASCLAVPAMAAALFLGSCQDPGTGPVTLVPPSCPDANVVALPRLSRTVHTRPKLVHVKTTAIEGIQWATGAEVQAFFGTK